LLVFYVPDWAEWQRAIDRFVEHGYQAVSAFNPYWDRHGKTFEDPDGYRVVLQKRRVAEVANAPRGRGAASLPGPPTVPTLRRRLVENRGWKRPRPRNEW
jgi:hypothetical protein